MFTLCSSPLDYHPKIDLLAAAKTKWVSFPFAHLSSISREGDQDIPFLKLSLSLSLSLLSISISVSVTLSFLLQHRRQHCGVKLRHFDIEVDSETASSNIRIGPAHLLT